MDRLRKRKKHRHSLYYFSDSESNSESASSNHDRRYALPVRSSQRLRNRKGSVSDEDSDGSSVEQEASDKSLNATINAEEDMPITLTNKAKSKVKQVSGNKATRTSKRRKLAVGLPPTKKSLSLSHGDKSLNTKSKFIPPWQNLDYQILLKIMQYAAYPLYEGASRDTGSIKWLLETSVLCLSFRDACMGVLMASPPLYPLDRAYGILKLLKSSEAKYGPFSHEEHSRDMVSIDYRKKVKCLNIEVRQILLKKQGINLKDLLTYTPLLKTLRLYHNHDSLIKDFIWAQPQHAKGRKWSYGDLFDTLDQLNIELTFFEWNDRFLRQDPTLSILAQAHTRRCLRRIKSLSLLHLGIHAEGHDQRMAEWRVNMLTALANMTDLAFLSIRNCDIFDAPTVSALPCTLRSLLIEGCLYLTSEAMHDYLHSKGSSLEILKLLHNRSMSLEFMSSLESTTPELQHLEVDLTYYDTTSFRDTEPLFDSLLPSGPPTWPSNLTYISVGPLRLLTTSDAENFYDSLVSAAPSLPHLRELRLKTILNDTSWRDRALLRSKWSAKMIDTFLSDANGQEVQVQVQGRQKQKQKRTSHRAQHSAAKPGRCHTVEFELSDQRPAQEQYKEADFLDAEPSDDAEWNGRDESTVPKYSAKRYAW